MALTFVLRLHGTEVLKGQHETSDEHVGVNEVSVYNSDEGVKLLLGVQHLVECLEGVNVELDELS